MLKLNRVARYDCVAYLEAGVSVSETVTVNYDDNTERDVNQRPSSAA